MHRSRSARLVVVAKSGKALPASAAWRCMALKQTKHSTDNATILKLLPGPDTENHATPAPPLTLNGVDVAHDVPPPPSLSVSALFPCHPQSMAVIKHHGLSSLGRGQPFFLVPSADYMVWHPPPFSFYLSSDEGSRSERRRWIFNSGEL